MNGPSQTVTTIRTVERIVLRAALYLGAFVSLQTMFGPHSGGGLMSELEFLAAAVCVAGLAASAKG